jgi:hypothetical protein
MRIAILKGLPAELEKAGNSRLEHLEREGGRIVDVRLTPHPPGSELIMVILYEPRAVCDAGAVRTGPAGPDASQGKPE